MTAKQSSPHGCAYAATKAGLSSFGKSLFEEARKYGVKVTTIHPDMTDTNLYRDADFTCGEEPESYLLPDEVAKAVAYVLDQREGHGCARDYAAAAAAPHCKKVGEI